MAETTSSDYRYWTSNGEFFGGRDPSLLDRWLYGAGKWGIAAGTHALSQEEQNRLRNITPAEAQRRIDSPEPICAMHFGGRGEEFQQARDAIRDILYLYRELTDYHGISGDHDTGTFKPWKFLDCSLEEGYGGPETEKLLHQGAAVALLCEMIDWADQGGPSASALDTHRSAVEQGRFDHLPTARAAVAAGLEGEEGMIPYPYLDAVYEEYVLAYFAELSRERRQR